MSEPLLGTGSSNPAGFSRERMRRAAGILLFVAATLISMYAWRSLSNVVGGLHGNAVPRYFKEGLFWHLRWALLSFLLTIAFVITARGRWRFAAVVPLIISAFVALGTAAFDASV